MKKLFAIMVALAAIVAFASCNKNDDNKNSLVGTTWVGKIDYATLTIEFKTKTDCALISTYEGESETINASYVYNAPNISITVTQEGHTETISGTVDGNKMSLTEDEETVVFTKK